MRRSGKKGEMKMNKREIVALRGKITGTTAMDHQKVGCGWTRKAMSIKQHANNPRRK